MEDLPAFLSAYLDLKVLGENVKYENRGTVVVPVEKAGIRFGEQRTAKTEGNKTIITDAIMQVIQRDKTIIKDSDDIFAECAKCSNFVLKKYAHLSLPYGKPLCMTHLKEVSGGKIFKKLLEMEMQQKAASEPKVELLEEGLPHDGRAAG